MIEFVNAKINIGLNIVGKREDGYHLLETVFYPIGCHNGTRYNPESFNDMLELTGDTSEGKEDIEISGVKMHFQGRPVECEPAKNLVAKAVAIFSEEFDRRSGREGSFARTISPMTLRLYKLLPDGAGMGGGSADASFTLKLLNDYLKQKGMTPFPISELEEMALRLGADCPVFIRNRPAYAEGVGEKLLILPEFLKGKWLVILKPDLSISTKEAFAGVNIRRPETPLYDLIRLPLKEWVNKIKNDFEESLFPNYPELSALKEELYEKGAEYASLTGSGAAIYGIFASEFEAERAKEGIRAPYKKTLLL